MRIRLKSNVIRQEIVNGDITNQDNFDEIEKTLYM